MQSIKRTYMSDVNEQRMKEKYVHVRRGWLNQQEEYEMLIQHAKGSSVENNDSVHRSKSMW